MRALRWLMVAGLAVAGCGTDESTTSTPADVEPEVASDDTTSRTVIEDDHGVTTGDTTSRTVIEDDHGVTTGDTTSRTVIEDDQGVATTSPDVTTSEIAGPGTVTFTTADGLPGDRVTQVDVGVDGTVWVAVEDESTAASAVAAMGYQRYARFDGDGWTDIGLPEIPASRTDPLGPFGMQLTGGADGVLWIVSTGFGSLADTFAYDGERWVSPVTVGIVATGAAGPDGSLWMFGVDLEGDATVVLYRLENGVLTPQPAPEGGFECVYCGTYDVDADGTFWTYARGVIQRFDGETWTLFESDPNGVAGTTEESIWRLGPDGSHWIVGRSEDGATPWAVARIRHDGVTRMPIGDDTEDADVVQGDLRAITADASGRLWLAVDGHGLYCVDLDGRTVTEFGTETLPTLEFSDLDAAPDGSVWVATNAGITRIVTDG